MISADTPDHQTTVLLIVIILFVLYCMVACLWAIYAAEKTQRIYGPYAKWSWAFLINFLLCPLAILWALLHPENEELPSLWALLHPEDEKLPRNANLNVDWVINDHGELGVKVNGDYHFLYMGRSTISQDGLYCDGTQMYVRLVRAREFGECCRPAGFLAPNLTGVDLGPWREVPPTTHADAT